MSDISLEKYGLQYVLDRYGLMMHTSPRCSELIPPFRRVVTKVFLESDSNLILSSVAAQQYRFNQVNNMTQLNDDSLCMMIVDHGPAERAAGQRFLGCRTCWLLLQLCLMCWTFALVDDAWCSEECNCLTVVSVEKAEGSDWRGSIRQT